MIIILTIQVFDTNVSSDKAFRFKVGRGKVIKVRYIMGVVTMLFAYLLLRVGMRVQLVCVKEVGEHW